MKQCLQEESRVHLAVPRDFLFAVLQKPAEKELSLFYMGRHTVVWGARTLIAEVAVTVQTGIIVRCTSDCADNDEILAAF